ncbi:MAG: MoaD/ThiS family protein [Betaproteobacteria bacterium]|nr:MoaD/ThiS family protein [Betaproteobacteria bacterium]
MARIILPSNLAELTGGETELELAAGNVRQLFELLGERYPQLRIYLEADFGVAIDGETYQDALLQPIGSGSEVILFPKIAGG